MCELLHLTSAMEIFSDNIRLFTSIIGIYAIIWWCIEHFTSLFELVINSIKPYIKCQCKMTLQKQYGQWAGKNHRNL